IRDVAYSGLTKSARAELHARFAEWLRERAGEELLEIRAYHLDQAASLLEELDGAAPRELASGAAEALEAAGRRALARESHAAAQAAGRADLEAQAAIGLAMLHVSRYENAQAAPLIERALELAEESGSMIVRADALGARATLLRHQGELDQAVSLYEEALA